MSEITEVLAAIESLRERGERMALATVVSVRGSAFRRPGARLLVPESGDPIGNISAGCLEGDVAEVAKLVMADGRAQMAYYDLTADDEAVWGWGLGCNGAIDVFVEPAEKAAEVAGALRMAIEEERPICMVTVLDSSVPGVDQGNRLLVGPEGYVQGSLGSPETDARAESIAMDLLGQERSETRVIPAPGGEVRAFVEVLEPPLRLVVCGAGHDAIALVRTASWLGWRVLVADDRPAFLNGERFPEASGFVHVERPDEISAAAGVDDRTFVVVMTHNFLRDKEYLRSLISSEAPYVGMLGAAARTERLLRELADERVSPTQEQRSRIHGPAGLDLGSEGPEEIAQAIVAEILAVKRGRAGGFLKERKGPIHGRSEAEAR
ncbi:MAG: XdhC family protein [Actinomycetota bacterium]